VMIAMALSCEPSVLLADEPTTALDVTVQAQILELMKSLQDRFWNSVLLVSHDLGVVAGLADTIAVMYGGRIVEQGSADDVFYNPQHPYTRGLLASIPQLEDKAPLRPIPGQPPDLARLPSGCPFRVRCNDALPECREAYPRSYPVRDEHWVRCWLQEDNR